MKRVSIRVVGEPALDIEQRLELLAGLRLVDEFTEVFDPRLDRTVRFLVPGGGSYEGHRLRCACSTSISEFKLEFLDFVRAPYARQAPPKLLRPVHQN